MDISAQTLISFAALLLLGASALTGSVIWILRGQNTGFQQGRTFTETCVKELRTALDSMQTSWNVKADNLETKLMLQMDKRDADNSRNRHDMRNDLQAPLGKIDLRIERLERDSAQKAELDALEKRFSSIISELKISIESVKDNLKPLPVIERDLKAIFQRLDRLPEKGQGGD